MPPNNPQDLLDRIAALENRLRAVEGRTQIRPALNQIVSGAVIVGEQGQFKVLDTDGSLIFWVGGIAPAHPDGSPQRGVLMYREDGSEAFTISTSGPEPQGLTMRDRSNTIIFAEDVATAGLARPYISSDAWFGATELPTYTTSSGTFTTLQHLAFHKQHPKVNAFYLCSTSGGTTGEIQLVDDSSNVVAGPISIGAGTAVYGNISGALPGSMNTFTYLHWQGRVTGGAGTIGVKGLSTFGVQT